MNILLIGYGKMGKTIEAQALKRGHAIIGKIDPLAGLQFDFSRKPDVAIEFTTPEAAPANVRRCIENGVPVLSGTTGWLAHKPSIDELCEEKGGTFFYSSNYSLGVNIFFKLNAQLATWMASLKGYEVAIDELHHTQKKDSPSGTAITLAEGIIKNSPLKKRWVNSETRAPEDLVIHSFREDPHAGTHTITYHSAIDDLQIKHVAHSREGFASGALDVAEWLPGQRGVLGMDDFLRF